LRPKAIDRAAVGRDDETAVRNGGRAGEAAGGLILPELHAVFQAEGIEPAVGGADKHAVAGDDGGAVDSLLGGEGPQLIAGFRIECLYAAIAAADDDDPLLHGR